jgi:hypothetical protein
MSTLIDELGGFKVIERISLERLDDYLVAFTNGKRVKLALWTTAVKHRINLDPKLNIETIINEDGSAVVRGNDRFLSISKQVNFISISEPFPAWLNIILEAFKASNVLSLGTLKAFINESGEDSLALAIYDGLNSQNQRRSSSSYQALSILANKQNIVADLKLKVYHRILKSDPDILNRKNALNKLTRINSAESLSTIKKFIQQPEFKQEAANYYLMLAKKYARNGEDQKAKELLVEAAKVSKHRTAIESVLETLAENGHILSTTDKRKFALKAGFINNWWIAGPFPNDNDLAENHSYFPENIIDFSQQESFDTLNAHWQKLESNDLYPIIPFASLFGKNQEAAYAYAKLNFPEKNKGKLKIGSNDGVVCWLNGKKVHEKLIARGLVVDEDEIFVNFKKGVNELLLKVINKGANWEACLRICDENGLPIDLNQYQINSQ